MRQHKTPRDGTIEQGTAAATGAGWAYAWEQPSLWSGLGGLFDFTGAMLIPNEPPADVDPDRFALAHDWWAIYEDYQRARAIIVSEHPDLSPAVA
ncbi:MAG: hypothetical protein ACRDGS_08725 [Chloroflexota bacterium]